MSHQSEIIYSEGDIVWVKLRSFWWPGKVVSLNKLPEDIQKEFEQKPLIAAVKFFQEDSFEFVKSYKQIYHYNCVQKIDFIKKGLDKYRIISKNGSALMDKFPEDIKTAEILTNGNPDILANDIFYQKKKTHALSLFGKKNSYFKEKEMSTSSKKTENINLYFNDFNPNIRVRTQSKGLATPSNTNSFITNYPCYMCNFITSRVNVIISHIRQHRLSKTPNFKSAISKRKVNPIKSIKKKQTKTSLVLSKTSNFSKIENNKKLMENSKINKVDPELREKLLADWTMESDEDDLFKSSVNKNINRETLRYTEKLSDNNKDYLQDEQNSSTVSYIKQSACSQNLYEDEDVTYDSDDILIKKNASNSKTKIDTSSDQNLQFNRDKNIELSCFDFDEEDFNQSNVPCIRKFNKESYRKNQSSTKVELKKINSYFSPTETETHKHVVKFSKANLNFLSCNLENEKDAVMLDYAKNVKNTDCNRDDTGKNETDILDKGTSQVIGRDMKFIESQVE